MSYGPYECDVATRKPAPLASTYADLCAAIPILKEFVYVVDGDRARNAYPERDHARMDWLLSRGAEHWIPGDIFAQLTGAVCGSCKVYGSREEALEDIGLAWAKARPDGRRREKGDDAASGTAGAGEVQVATGHPG